MHAAFNVRVPAWYISRARLFAVSASIPQLQEAIAELQAKGYPIPSLPANPSTAEEKEVAARYAKVTRPYRASMESELAPHCALRPDACLRRVTTMVESSGSVCAHARIV